LTRLRIGDYAPIEDYAVIGDGRTVALVARDGSIDWLCLPDIDSPSVFAGILDSERGGAFVIRPEGKFEAEMRYLDDTNVLETTFRTSSGTARVTDAMTLAGDGELAPLREIVRRVEGLTGRVPFSWSFKPRFEYGRRVPALKRRAGRLVAASGKDALGLSMFGAGGATISRGRAEGRFELGGGERALFALSAAHVEPLVLAGRADAERRLDAAAEFWREWAGRNDYDGRWRGQVVRSALALKLLVFAPSGAIVAAPTAALPEWIGGGRNWDYRYAWVRDAALTLATFLRLGHQDEARAFLWWLAHATALTQPRLDVLYTVDGGSSHPEEDLEGLAGYRGSRPVRVGNAAKDQVQLDVYGYALHAVWRYATETGELAGGHGRAVAKIADWVAGHWREPDSGIWEVRSEPAHFTQSKAMCAVALERACDLADAGLVPDRSERWREAAAAIRRFVDEHGWDEQRRTYLRAPGLTDTDGSLLTLGLLGYEDSRSDRIDGLRDRIRSELMHGPLVDRYRGDDGVAGPQGVFITCSFWFVSALARAGRVDEAIAMMDELLALANGVGLYAEEVDAEGRFLGNFPQGLVHLALIDAALDVADAEAAA
jgi:GH15 family glucan-1,4-alpha-glucosidase